jgi:hypothetical protein
MKQTYYTNIPGTGYHQFERLQQRKLLWADVLDMLLVDFLLPHRNPGKVWHCQREALALSLVLVSSSVKYLLEH